MIKRFSPDQSVIPYERCAAHEAETDALEQLMEAVGPERFRRIQELFGGQRVWIPKPGAEQPCRRCPDRDRRIQDLRKRGASVYQLAERFGLSPKRGYAILRRDILSSTANENCSKRERVLAWPGR